MLTMSLWSNCFGVFWNFENERYYSRICLC